MNTMNFRKIANTLSWVLHPFLLPVYLMALLLTMTTFALYSANVKFYFMRRERLLPLLIGTVCYVLCALTFAKIPSAIFLRKFMVAAACCEAMCFVVSLRWKISLHLTGMGAIVALLVVMNVVGVGNMLIPLAAAILCAGALASARLYLGCHNPRQVAAGFFGGFCVSLLAVLFL